MVLQKPQMEIGAIIPDAPLRASFYPSSTMSPVLKSTIEENEKFVKMINIPDIRLEKLIKRSFSLTGKNSNKVSIKSYLKEEGLRV
jgi:hypothetical protein